MKILVLNCGSSSLKFQLINMDNNERMAKGNFERIGGMKTTLKLNVGGKKEELLHIARDFDEAIEFVFKIITKPEVKIKKYKGLGVKEEKVEVTKEEIEHEIGHLLERFTETRTKEKGKVENGNIAIIDFEGFNDGVAFEGGKAEGHELEIGSGSFIPGFEDQLVGMKIDEEKDINVKFPEEYFSKDLAGKDAVFKVKLHAIKKKELPELDDEFAKDVSEFDTLAELKASIKKKL